MEKQSRLGKLSNSLDSTLSAIGSVMMLSTQLIFIGIVLAVHAGIILAGIFGYASVLTSLNIASIAILVLPTLIKQLDKLGGRWGGDDEALEILAVFFVGAEYEGIVGKLVFIVRYGLIPTNIVGFWLIT